MTHVISSSRHRGLALVLPDQAERGIPGPRPPAPELPARYARLGACRSETAADAATEDPRRGIFRPIGLVVRQEIAELSRKIVA